MLSYQNICRRPNPTIRVITSSCSRGFGKCAVALVVFHALCHGAFAGPTAEARHCRVGQGRPCQVAASNSRMDAHRLVTKTPASPSAEASIKLSPQERLVSEFVDQNGDREFLMVDKIRGEILLFQNGQPVFAGAALTGASFADRMPSERACQTVLHPCEHRGEDYPGRTIYGTMEIRSRPGWPCPRNQRDPRRGLG